MAPLSTLSPFIMSKRVGGNRMIIRSAGRVGKIQIFGLEAYFKSLYVWVKAFREITSISFRNALRTSSVTVFLIL